MDWFSDNLTAGNGIHSNWDWKDTFMVTCDLLWNWRNRDIFEEGFSSPYNMTQHILREVQDIHNARSKPSTKSP